MPDIKPTKPIYSTRVLRILTALHKKLPKKTDPLIKGSLLVVHRVCGQKNCRCTRGHRHKSLYLSQSKNGKCRMIYIPKKAEDEVRRAVLNHRKIKTLLNRLSRIHLKRLKGSLAV